MTCKIIYTTKIILVQLFAFCTCFLNSSGQQYFGQDNLQLVREIPLKNITGKITGISVDTKNQVLYIAGQTSFSMDIDINSIEAFDLNNGNLISKFEKIIDPQLICYIPEREEIFISTGGTKCYFYSTKDFKKIATLKLTASVNTIYYDTAAKKIYAGYGDDELAIINVDSHKQTGFMLLPAQIESIQLDKSLNRLYAFMPESRQTAVIDLNKFSLLNNWLTEEKLINQITIDTVKHRLFACSNKKPELYIIDGISGAKTSMPLNLKSPESIYYDTKSQSLYITGKEAVNIYRENADSFTQIANIPLPTGAKTTLFIPDLKLIIMNREERHKIKAGLFIYRIKV